MCILKSLITKHFSVIWWENAEDILYKYEKIIK